MTSRRRIVTFILSTLALVFFLAFSSRLEFNELSMQLLKDIEPSLVQAAVFFGILGINLLVLIVFIFLVLRSAIRLTIDRRRGVFGSRLQSKLVTMFLFFSLLPTVVLLFMTTKFVNADFEKLLPESLIEMSAKRNEIQSELQSLVSKVWMTNSNKHGYPAVFDFEYLIPSKEFRIAQIQSESEPLEKREIQEIQIALQKSLEKEWSESVRWMSTLSGTSFAITRGGDNRVIGIFGPKNLLFQQALFDGRAQGAEAGITVIQVSYYVMLGVLTLMILFSATWLGFSIAQEYLRPIQVLANATDRVAQGDYDVEIDEIISDDELGQLAQSFRSMVRDLRKAQTQAQGWTAELESKNSQLYLKSEYNEFLLKHANSGIVVVSDMGGIKSENQKSSQIFANSISEQNPTQVKEYFGEEFHQAFLVNTQTRETLQSSTLAEKEVRTFQFRGAVHGLEKQLVVKVTPIGGMSERNDLLVLIDDVTEIARVQRAEAWRDVARRIAHEIKNPLTPITLGIQRLQRRFQSQFDGQDEEVFQECSQVVLDSTESIRKLVDEFIRFARMPQAELSQGDLLHHARRVVSSLQHEDGLSIPFSADAKSILVNFDADQMKRLLENLISNALHAAQETEGRVSVAFSIDPGGSSALLSVQDTGPGISDALRSQIFEPYFSTRRSGTGLGLAIVNQIVAEHGGEIELSQNKPRGSVFSVRLPVIAFEKQSAGFDRKG